MAKREKKSGGGVGKSGTGAERRKAVSPRYWNRDLSWLMFNQRVLAQALDEASPLLERLKFLAIYASNLDEFFMKRVGLMRQRRSLHGGGYTSIDGRSAGAILHEIRAMVIGQQEEQARCWETSVRPALAAAGIEIVAYEALGGDERAWVDSWYERNVFPTLTPLAVDPGQRFPFISNLSENFGVRLVPAESPEGDEEHEEPVFARVKIPSVLPRFVRIGLGSGGASGGGGGSGGGQSDDGPGSSLRFVLLDDLIGAHLEDMFPGMRVIDALRFRVTRSAAVERGDDEDADDLIELVEDELRRRRIAEAVRLEVPPGPNRPLVGLLCEELGLEQDAVYERDGLLEYGDLFELYGLSRPDLKDRPWTPVVPRALADGSGSGSIDEGMDVFSVIRRRDVLVHHPYDSFEHSVERFVASAAADPDVLTIKQTLYRTSPDSPFVNNLIAAAERGKQVACLVEVRARFDESRNVQFARRLERAGVHVSYGKVGLKTHCKCSLVVRRERGEDGEHLVRCYAHLGTGNYHPKTAQLYTDLGLLTADEAVTGDVVRLFNVLTGRAAGQRYERLLVAPDGMRSAYEEMIDAEIAAAKRGEHALIIAKMNQLEDRKLIDRLYRASSAGVKIRCFVRGFCGLRAGVEGLSENIEVISVLGRFLEHSRVYYFASGCDPDSPLDGRFYISSADWMYRNLNNRVEASCPVEDRAARARLWEIFDVMNRDGKRAWRLEPDGTWSRREVDAAGADPEGPEHLGTFGALMARARQQAGG